MNRANKENEADAIYSFGLPDVEPTAKLTCAFCGAPAISELEIYDEVICDYCYSIDRKARAVVDAQYAAGVEE